jgi:hypothetical protein
MTPIAAAAIFLFMLSPPQNSMGKYEYKSIGLIIVPCSISFERETPARPQV